jgi:hypothetical protein
MLTVTTLLRILSRFDWSNFSSALIGCSGNVRELTCHRRLPVCIFSVKVAALESLKKQKIVITISACTENTYLLL